MEKLKKEASPHKLIKMANAYVDALRNSKTSNVKTILSPKRQIVKDQKERCYMCEKNLGSAMCYFAEIEGPDMDTGLPGKSTRAICSSCFFVLGKNPVKQTKKKETIKENTKVKEKQEEVNLFKELRISKNKTKDEMYNQWD